MVEVISHLDETHVLAMNMKPTSRNIELVPAIWLERKQRREQSEFIDLWDLLDQVKDPEIPVLSLWDLGVLYNIEKNSQSELVIIITPTYSGCPAMDVMRQEIAKVLTESGYPDHTIKTQYAPAWSSDWMSPQGKKKLQGYGIAPPLCQRSRDSNMAESEITCPHCGSKNISLVSEFGSTACKALYKCQDCLEPFDYFKAI